jgi:hypothetical protein
MILLRGSARDQFHSPYPLRECVMRIRSLNKGIYGISSTRSSVWRIDGEHGGFLVERRMMLTRIAQVNGTLRKENDNTTFIQFEYRLNPQMVFMFYLVLILA